MYSLHAHTDGSNTRLLDCINKVEHLIDTAHDIGLFGVAITDHENIVNHVKAQKHLTKRKKENPNDTSWQNFKLILGNEIYLCRNDLSEANFNKETDDFYHFILLALDEEGHKQIRELSTRAFKHSWYRNMRRVPTYYRDIEEVIGANPGHVWGSTACLGSYFAHCVRTNNGVEGKKFIDWCQSIFGENFSLELQPVNDKEQEMVNTAAYHTAIKRGLPFIATTDAHYLRPDDKKLHKAFLNSKGGDRETDAFYATTYLMTQDEVIHSLKADYAELACLNTLIIGNKVKEYSLLKETKLPYMPLNVLAQPDFPKTPINMEYLREFYVSKEPADRQLANKIIEFINSNDNVDYERIEIELKSISITDSNMNQKWAKYLLQVSDYVDIFWKDGDTLVGPARGSGAGFYINYILNISQIDPTKEKARCYPWRFLNPERASILDIDTDIQGNRRNKCIRALKNKYGEFRAVEVATFGTEKAKSAIKTACRGLGIDVDIATYLSSFIESDRGIQRSLSQTFYGDEENGFPANKTFRTLMTKDYPQVWEVACRIEGLISRVGKHAGGVVIVDEDFTERAAIMTTNKDEFVSQFELHDLEDLGQLLRPNKILNCLSAA